jgi:hypothetical protein
MAEATKLFFRTTGLCGNNSHSTFCTIKTPAIDYACKARPSIKSLARPSKQKTHNKC